LVLVQIVVPPPTVEFPAVAKDIIDCATCLAFKGSQNRGKPGAGFCRCYSTLRRWCEAWTIRWPLDRRWPFTPSHSMTIGQPKG